MHVWLVFYVTGRISRDDLYENDHSRCFRASISSSSNMPRAKSSGTHNPPRCPDYVPHTEHLRHERAYFRRRAARCWCIIVKHVDEFIGAARVWRPNVPQNLEEPALLSVLHDLIMCSHVLCIPTSPAFAVLVSCPLQEALHVASVAGGNVSTGFIRRALG